MSKEEKLWKKFCKQTKNKLSEIVQPAVDGDNSYECLIDIIINIMLFELNLDKKPWDEIPTFFTYRPFPQRKVKALDSDAIKDDVLSRVSNKRLRKELEDRLEDNVGYHDRPALELDETDLSNYALYIALRRYKNKYEEDE